MGVDPIVSLAVGMKQQSLKEAASFGVAKLALEQMEQSGKDIVEMLGGSGSNVSTAVSLDVNLGRLVDISL